jgi:undecaprenyl-diphosphatase
MSHMTYLEASVVGLIQGVTELFPVSSLGHNVLIPALVGGSWATDLNVATPESPYLAFIVGLHVATALAMLIYFWRDWVRIIGGFFSSIRHGRVETVDEKLAWMIILATIPVGIVGLEFEHAFRVLFGQPIRAAIFLVVNGLILFSGERFRTRKSREADAIARAAAQVAAGSGSGTTRAGSASAGTRSASGLTQSAVGDGTAEAAAAAPAAAASGAAMPGVAAAGERTPGGVANLDAAAAGAAGPGTAAGELAAVGAGGARGDSSGPATHASGQRAVRKQEIATAIQADQRLSAVGYAQALIIGSAQILALLAGISRDGVVMVTGMFSGLSRQDAARFSFLLSTPVIFAAGALKVGDLMGPLGDGIRGQVLAGSILSGVGAYLAVRFLMRYFQTRTLTPFAIYCVVFGLGSIIYLQLR